MDRTCGMLAMLGTVWAIDRRRFGAIGDLVKSVAETPPGEGVRGFLFAQGGTASRQGRIAVLRLSGVIEQKQSLMGEFLGGTSTEAFGDVFDAAIAEPSVKGVLIDVDSPGGTISGVPELSDRIFAAREVGKPIVAVANPLMASAAYWIGSAAHRVFITPSGEAGSIGVLAAHMDFSEALAQDGIKATIIESVPFKSEFASVKPLSDDARDFLQGQVDEAHGQFVDAVARNRGVQTARVNADFGKGRVFMADAARKSGMVDRVATFEEVVSRMAAGRIRVSKSAAHDDWETPSAGTRNIKNFKRRLSIRSRKVDTAPTAS